MFNTVKPAWGSCCTLGEGGAKRLTLIRLEAAYRWAVRNRLSEASRPNPLLLK